MMKHTPGPWQVLGNTVFSQHGQWIGHTDSAATPLEERKANARLFALAPDLLKFVQDAGGEYGTEGDPLSWREDARRLLTRLETP
jgi:hypothetical protein